MTKHDNRASADVAAPQLVCAWCLKERGEQAKETDSHGICERHVEQTLLAYHAHPDYQERRRRRRERA